MNKCGVKVLASMRFYFSSSNSIKNKTLHTTLICIMSFVHRYPYPQYCLCDCFCINLLIFLNSLPQVSPKGSSWSYQWKNSTCRKPRLNFDLQFTSPIWTNIKWNTFYKLCQRQTRTIPIPLPKDLCVSRTFFAETTPTRKHSNAITQQTGAIVTSFAYWRAVNNLTASNRAT